MSLAVKEPLDVATKAAALKAAMRGLVGGVSVITAGTGPARTGMTATSATALSMDPPTMLVCINAGASTWPVIRAHGHFCVNILAADQQDIAERFAGRGGIKGPERYEGADWRVLGSGASGLADALAVIDCDVEDLIPRHSHIIVIGAVRSVHLGGPPGRPALLYGHGRYGASTLA